jgi:hypothetical protein
VFQDPEYVKWANAETIHLLSYDLQPDLEGGAKEEMATVEREGEKVEVLAHYPMFTADEITSLLNEIGSRLEFPTKTPWEGLLSPDGKKILWDNPEKKRTAKDFREAYEAEQKKAGKVLPKADWAKVCALIERSKAADADSKFREAVTAILEAKAAAKDYPAPLVARIQSWADTLNAEGESLLDDAKATKDPAARSKAVAKVAADFAGLPVAEAAKESAR